MSLLNTTTCPDCGQELDDVGSAGCMCQLGPRHLREGDGRLRRSDACVGGLHCTWSMREMSARRWHGAPKR
jgi:hypothetical protein